MNSYSLSILFIVALLMSCQNEKTVSPITTKSGTEEMVAELKQIATKSSKLPMWHQNKTKAIMMDQQIKSITDPGQKLSLLFQSGAEWLNAGDYNTAIDRFNNIFQFMKDNNVTVSKETMKTFKEVTGIAHLRKAEIENCLQNHNEYSCILPIAPQGQHTKKAGSEAAAVIFKEILADNPDDIQVKWLYNIAKMTLGAYPDGVEKNWLIPPSVFESTVDFPRMTDKAMELGIAVNDISGSVVMDDFNNDHYLDLLVSSYGLDDQLRYYQNDTKGGFSDLTDAAGIKGIWSGLNMVQADYDNDGWLDVLILRGAWRNKEGNHPNSLLRNNGDGTFSDVTKETGLYTLLPTQTASWADYNNDGWIDLFIANEHSASMSAPCQLFENQGNGTFVEVAQAKGLQIKAFIKGCVWGDYNNDGNPDLYLSTIQGVNYLMENGGASQNFIFKNVAEQTGTTAPLRSFPCWFFDYDQDGWEDIFVSGFDFSQFGTAAGSVAKDYLGEAVDAELPKLYRNNQNGTFTDVTETTETDKVLFTMGCNFGDLNNDGFPDFYAATGTPDFRALVPNRMFLNKEGKRFVDITKSAGLGHLQKGHGVAFGDVDMDGDQDIYHVLGGSYDGDNFMNALFVNAENKHHWIKLKLIGTTANKSAIGSRVKLVVMNEQGVKKEFFTSVNSGGSFGANPLLVEQGLATFNKILEVEIRWAGQQEPQIISGLQVDQYYIIRQGQNKAENIDINSVTLGGNHDHHH